jgi:hypothetical protein
MVHATRAYLPYFRLIKATSGLREQPYVVYPFRGIIVYDGNAPLACRYAYVAKAIHELWKHRYLAGLDEYDHPTYPPRLSAVS